MGGVLILAALTLTACDNFLDAKETCNQIQSAIAYNNASSYRILVTAEKDSGIIRKPITGEVSKKVTDTFDIKFEPNDDFSFMGWNAYSEQLPQGEDINDYIEFEDSMDPETKVTFKKALNGIVIMAVCPHYPFTEFTLTGSNGKFSPVKGNYTCVMSHTYNLSFEPDMDWEFIRWQIYNIKTDEEIPNGKYIKIQNLLEENTTYSLVCPAEDDQISLGIRPIVTERPQILSYSPILSNELAYKDTTIQVIFDHDMDENSIYYTDNELTALMLELGITDRQDENLLRTKTNPAKYYGYKKNGETFFKTISLKDNKDSTSLNHYFEEPVFENPRTLSISVITDKAHLFDNYTKILVTLDNTFFYKIKIDDNKSKEINMAGSKKWIYQVNSETDGEKPYVESLAFGTLSSKPQPLMNNYTQIKQLDLLPDSNKFNLNISLKDLKSGPVSSFIMNLQRIADSDYNEVSEQQITTTLDFDYVNSQEASFKNEIDYSKLQDGVYAVSFVFSDRSKNAMIYPSGDEKLYFAVDNTVPEAINNLVVTHSEMDKAVLNWNCNTRDAGFEITYTTDDGTTGTVTCSEEDIGLYTRTADIDNKINYYTFSVVSVDAAGHKSQPVEQRFYTSFVHVPANSDNTISAMFVCDHETTQGEYEKYMMYCSNEEHHNTEGGYVCDAYGKGDWYPAYCVSWYDAIMYCNLRSVAEGFIPVYYTVIDGQNITDVDTWALYETRIIKDPESGKYYYYPEDYVLNEGQNDQSEPYQDCSSLFDNIKCNGNADGYRLPTVKEWSYIAQVNNSELLSNTSNDYAWFNETTSHEVRTKLPNALGIYDISGNVVEWCWDLVNSYYIEMDGVTSINTVPNTRAFKLSCYNSAINNNLLQMVTGFDIGWGRVYFSSPGTQSFVNMYVIGFRVVRNAR